MDRYFNSVEKSLPSSELHLTGIVTMFIASKYEDVVPLMMRTVVNKIGHNKFELRQIEEKELEILKVLGYKIGYPTVKEFLDRFMEELAEIIPLTEQMKSQLICLSKMTCYSYEMMQLPSSLLAASLIKVALTQGVISAKKMETEDVMATIADFAGLKTEEVDENA
jgi:hypothetical protein